MRFRHAWAAAMAAVVLVACGGGGGGAGVGSGAGQGDGGGGTAPPPTATPPVTSSVKVVGDDLSDSGTFGTKYTVQGPPGYPIWTDRVAAAFGLPALCARYTAAPHGTPAMQASAACTSHGVGNARIHFQLPGTEISAYSIMKQFTDLRSAGPYAAKDLLLVQGGTNDIRELVRTYTVSSFDGGWAFVEFVKTLVTAADLTGLTLPQAGEAYAIRLADLWADAIQTQALDHGAQKVVLLNVPDVSATPRFVATRNWVEGYRPAMAAQLEGVANQWVAAFNARLQTRLAGERRVLLVDLHGRFNEWLKEPTRHGFTNTTAPACPIYGAPGPIPDYDLATCTDTALAESPPSGASGPDGWKSYLFADDLHGTPRMHELLANVVVQALESKGWK